ncbi:MAG: M20/M25/M40 family metallo-hydrolase [Parasphingopyxis sp.]
MNTFWKVTAGLFVLLASPAPAELAPAEHRIAETVDGEFERSVALLERLTNQNSGTRNFAGNRAVADMLRPEFEALGFSVEWIDQSAADRAGHLFARHEGAPGTTRMLLIAHTDTVFEEDSPFQSFARDGDSATGPGVVDDKGGIVVILAALRAMEAAGTLEDANIVVALTGDEEDAGDPLEIARADLREAADRADVALDFEGLSIEEGRDMGVIARRSSNSWTLRTSGTIAHSSGIFSDRVGDGAIYEMARILAAFREELPEPNLTFNVGLVAGGTTAELSEDQLSATATGKTNVVPPVAVARGDFRTLSQDQTDRVVAGMERIVAGNLPGTDAEIAFELRYPPMAPTEGNRALLARLNAVNRDLGLAEQPVLDPLKRGAGDINFVADRIDGIAGLGPAGEGSHTPGETIDLPSIRRQAKRAAILMTRLAAEPR